MYCELTALLMITSKGQSSRLAQKRKAREVARGAATSTSTHEFASTSASSISSSSKRNAASQETLRKQAAGISDFIMEKLQGRASSTSGISAQVSPAAYLTLLPTIWTLINSAGVLAPEDQRNHGQHQQHNEVLKVALDHAVKVSSKAATKRLTVEFLSRLVLVRTLHTFDPVFSWSSC